ncbi:MAG TPA: hypothetical protein VEW42_01590 [Candidatus Eisenbacteria bacterium]|nr:hypothetical protein [Candidatus Eisenbacteria bacterium]
MQQKFIQVGNSKGIIISQDLIKKLGFDTTKQVHVEPDLQMGAIVITKNPAVQKSTNPRLLSILEKVNKEYGPALKKLANL